MAEEAQRRREEQERQERHQRELSVLEAWIFNMRSQFLSKRSDILPPHSVAKVYQYDEASKQLKNKTTQKTLDEEAITCGLGHWFPRPIGLDSFPTTSSSNAVVPSLFSFAPAATTTTWDPLLPLCVAAAGVSETRIPLDVLKQAFIERHKLERIVSSVNSDLKQLLHSPRWMQNVNALKGAYGDSIFTAGVQLKELVATTTADAAPQEQDAEAQARAQAQAAEAIAAKIIDDSNSNGRIRPVLALIAKLGCIKQAVWDAVVKKVKEKAKTVSNYSEEVQTKLVEKVKRYVKYSVTPNGTLDGIGLRFIASCELTPNAIFVRAALYESGVRGVSNVSTLNAEVGTYEQRKAVVSTGAFTLALVDIIAPDAKIAEAIWHRVVSAHDPFRVSNVDAMFHSLHEEDKQILKSSCDFGSPSTMRYIHEYHGDVPYDNHVPHAMRFESEQKKASVTFTYAPELSAFRLHDTRVYAQRYSRWVGDAIVLSPPPPPVLAAAAQ